MATEKCRWCGEWIDIPISENRENDAFIRVHHVSEANAGEQPSGKKLLFCSEDCLLDWAISDV